MSDTAKDFILWARQNSIRLHEIHIGEVSARFDDLAIVMPQAKPKGADPADQDVYAAWAKHLGMTYNGGTEDEDE